MKYIITLICTIAFAFQVNAQKVEADKVPAAVKANFSSMFKASISPSWEIKNGNYEATFTSGGVESIGLFQADGRFIQYEWNIKTGDLPEAAKTYMNGKTITGQKRIKNIAGSVSYEIYTIDAKYMFDDKGSFISSK